MAVVSSRQAAKGRSFPQELAYTAFASFRASDSPRLLSREDRSEMSAQAVLTLASVPRVALRGTYHVSGYGAEADLLLWLAAPTPDALQDALSAFRQTPLASAFDPVWSAFGMHRGPEPGRVVSIAAYYRGDSALRYTCVLPIVHAQEWHSLPSSGQRRLEADLDRALKHTPGALISLVTASGLGRCELLLAVEASDPGMLVDVVRDIEASEYRRYVSGPLVAITGARKPLAEIVDSLP
jgi:chlorite dismutase